MSSEIEIRCGNCRKFYCGGTTFDGLKIGWCDEFAGVPVNEECSCDGAAFREKEGIKK